MILLFGFLRNITYIREILKSLNKLKNFNESFTFGPIIRSCMMLWTSHYFRLYDIIQKPFIELSLHDRNYPLLHACTLRARGVHY